MVRQSKRKNLPSKMVFDHRRTWGSRLRTELRAMGKSPKWLGEMVGYKTPSSMFQVVNGHQGISREVYKKILNFVPAMRDFWEPPMSVESQGNGAPGPHKLHDYPSIGPRDVAGFQGQVRVGAQLLASVEADQEAITLDVVKGQRFEPDEARRLAELLIVAAYHCELIRDNAGSST